MRLLHARCMRFARASACARTCFGWSCRAFACAFAFAAIRFCLRFCPRFCVRGCVRLRALVHAPSCACCAFACVCACSRMNFVCGFACACLRNCTVCAGTCAYMCVATCLHTHFACACVRVLRARSRAVADICGRSHAVADVYGCMRLYSFWHVCTLCINVCMRLSTSLHAPVIAFARACMIRVYVVACVLFCVPFYARLHALVSVCACAYTRALHVVPLWFRRPSSVALSRAKKRQNKKDN